MPAFTGAAVGINTSVLAGQDGKKLTARQVETGFTRTVNTDRGGNYLLVELPIGHYRVEVLVDGVRVDEQTFDVVAY